MKQTLKTFAVIATMGSLPMAANAQTAAPDTATPPMAGTGDMMGTMDGDSMKMDGGSMKMDGMSQPDMMGQMMQMMQMMQMAQMMGDCQKMMADMSMMGPGMGPGMGSGTDPMMNQQADPAPKG